MRHSQLPLVYLPDDAVRWRCRTQAEYHDTVVLAVCGAACSSALPLLASLLPVCMFELNTPLQLVLLSMSFFHPYIRTPPCNQHLPIADCLVSPSSMYFLALAPLPIRSLAIHCYQLPAGLLAIPQLSLVAVSSALCFTITACTLPRSLR